jgi:hypothetical protein
MTSRWPGPDRQPVPSLVVAAQTVAEHLGFPLTGEEAGPGGASACLPGVGRFLAVLAAGCVGGPDRSGPPRPVPFAPGRNQDQLSGASPGRRAGPLLIKERYPFFADHEAQTEREIPVVVLTRT